MPPTPLSRFQAFWIRIWLTFVLIGILLFAIGVYPDLIGMDRSPVVGFVQVGVWLFGLALFLIAAYAAIRVFRNSRPLSLRAEIGERMIATGYVVAAAASMADFIGLGSDTIPELTFGPLQVIGLTVGVVTCVVGIILYWPWKRGSRQSDPDSDLPTDENTSIEEEGG
jgi:hypothetical protein